MNARRALVAGLLCVIGSWPARAGAQIAPASQAATTAPSGPTFYVDANRPAAADTNPGTAEKPWKTIQQAAKAMVAGDTTIVKAGTYKEQVFVNAHSGEPNKLITFKAGPGEKVLIDGEKTRQFGFRISASYIRVEGFEITRVTGNGVLVGNSGHFPGCEIVDNDIHDIGQGKMSAAVYYAGGHHGLIQGNHLHHNAGDGIGMYTDDLTVRGNMIDHNGVDGMIGGGKGLMLIENNVINSQVSGENHGDGMQLMGMTGTLVVRNNTVWDCTQDIYCCDYAEPPGSHNWGDVYIYNNVVFNSQPGPKGNGGYTNGIVTGAWYSAWKSITICNNTLVNCNEASGGVAFAIMPLKGYTGQKIDQVRILNNLFFNSTNMTRVSTLEVPGTQFQMDYNAYYNTREWYIGEGWSTLDKFRAAHPKYEAHGFFSDGIQFANYQVANPDCHLAAGSAVIGKGVAIPPVGDIRFDLDKDGRPRPKDGPWDIGAYQFLPPADANQ